VPGRGFGLCCRVVPRPLGAGACRGFGLWRRFVPRWPCACVCCGFGLCWELFLLYWVPACAIGAGERSDAGLLGWARRGGRKGGVGETWRGTLGPEGEGFPSGFPPAAFDFAVGLAACLRLLLFPTSVAPLAVGVRSGTAVSSVVCAFLQAGRPTAPPSGAQWPNGRGRDWAGGVRGLCSTYVGRVGGEPRLGSLRKRRERPTCVRGERTFICLIVANPRNFRMVKFMLMNDKQHFTFCPRYLKRFGGSTHRLALAFGHVHTQLPL
jgi:hypothetical protein